MYLKKFIEAEPLVLVHTSALPLTPGLPILCLGKSIKPGHQGFQDLSKGKVLGGGGVEEVLEKKGKERGYDDQY